MNEPFTFDEKKRLFMTLDAQTAQLKKLEQGMYGDKDLKIPGLITDVTGLKIWRENVRLKVAFISGLAVAIWELLKSGWEYLINHK